MEICITCESTPYKCKGGMRYPVLLSSSALHQCQGRRESNRYRGNYLHIKECTIRPWCLYRWLEPRVVGWVFWNLQANICDYNMRPQLCPERKDPRPDHQLILKATGSSSSTHSKGRAQLFWYCSHNYPAQDSSSKGETMWSNTR